MLVCLSVYLFIYIAMSDRDCLVKKINQGTDVFTHKHTELPASSVRIICVLKHVRARLIILTSGKNSQIIKIAGSGQLAVCIHPLDCKDTFLSFPKMLMHSLPVWRALLFHTLKFKIHYFQFVNFTHLFSLPIHPYSLRNTVGKSHRSGYTYVTQ